MDCKITHRHLLAHPAITGKPAATGCFSVVAGAGVITVFDKDVLKGKGQCEFKADPFSEQEKQDRHGDTVSFAGLQVGR
ncbi:hypothetical protein Z042_14855 [Chania multitudinisentens RB-25]|uniref:Uncharacterized protein n=1 Tax=Chania multitudinisentens RB-25 TaxID=1441930 RepID=W0LGG4_9GAMM|nr:hypothetical protein Z042_14855 [Chania multitudinisentens RB-25]